jgi:hypothetical protein
MSDGDPSTVEKNTTAWKKGGNELIARLDNCLSLAQYAIVDRIDGNHTRPLVTFPISEAYRPPVRFRSILPTSFFKFSPSRNGRRVSFHSHNCQSPKIPWLTFNRHQRSEIDQIHIDFRVGRLIWHRKGDIIYVRPYPRISSSHSIPNILPWIRGWLLNQYWAGNNQNGPKESEGPAKFHQCSCLSFKSVTYSACPAIDKIAISAR